MIAAEAIAALEALAAEWAPVPEVTEALADAIDVLERWTTGRPLGRRRAGA